MINEPVLNQSVMADLNPTVAEEFFEQTLFDDVLIMQSVRQVSEATAISFEKLRDEVYQSLFQVFQKARGIGTNASEKAEKTEDDLFPIFEMFFKGYYQHFRQAMETLITAESPVKVAFVLGQKSDRLNQLLDQFIREVEADLK